MKRTLAATMICRNEVHNAPRLFKNLNGLVDAIYITDTGSNDGTVEYLNSAQAEKDAGCPVHVFHFQWCDDFSKARNHNLEHIKEDYWLWVDLDDEISKREEFLAWKQAAMPLADSWFVPYNYAFHENGVIACTFLRERCFKTSLKVEFKDFVHEGVKIPEGVQGQATKSWAIDHKRTQEEAKGDRGRNLKILEDKKTSLSPRLQFYFGKELFDHDRAIEAEVVLREVVKYPVESLNLGDRILAFQYLIHSLIKNHKYDDAIQYGHLAIHLDSNRAEYHCFIAEAYCLKNEHIKGIPYFSAAKACLNRGTGLTHEFTFDGCYNLHPRMSLARLYFQMGRFEECIDEVKNLDEKEARDILYAAHKALQDTQISNSAIECDDIVITCPAQGAYPWNEQLHEEKGLGGSETAAVEMARLLKKKTGRQVRIFNNTEELIIAKSGVEYRPAMEVYTYFKKWKPKLHVAWRHSERLTNAPSYLWCHDLVCPGGERHGNYDKVMALSEFHMNYLQANQGIPRSKMMKIWNGIDPDLINKVRAKNLKRNPYKVIWPSSLDRGTEHAIMAVEKAREIFPELELHIFYGIENLYKYGLGQKADQLKEIMATRPWVKYVGNVPKERLLEEYATSSIWLYPATFIESYAITCLESIYMGCYPIVRNIGALPNTLKPFHDKGLCDIKDLEATQYDQWSDLVTRAISERKFDKIEAANLDPNDNSWERLADHWIKEFDL